MFIGRPREKHIVNLPILESVALKWKSLFKTMTWISKLTTVLRFSSDTFEAHHQVGCHCTASWPSGRLLSFQSGRLRFPSFFLTGRNELQPFSVSQIQQKVPEKYKNKMNIKSLTPPPAHKPKANTLTMIRWKPVPEYLHRRRQSQDWRRGASLQFPHQLLHHPQQHHWSRWSRCRTCRAATYLEAV